MADMTSESPNTSLDEIRSVTHLHHVAPPSASYTSERDVEHGANTDRRPFSFPNRIRAMHAAPASHTTGILSNPGAGPFDFAQTCGGRNWNIRSDGTR
jgi:hypothetical protein